MESKTPGNPSKEFQKLHLRTPANYGKTIISYFKRKNGVDIRLVVQLPKTDQEANSKVKIAINTWENLKESFLISLTTKKIQEFFDPAFFDDRKLIRYLLFFRVPQNTIQMIDQQFFLDDLELVKKLIRTCLSALILFRERNIQLVISQENLFMSED